MFAFWIGTVPALTALTMGARSLIPKFRAALPIVASMLLIVTGLYTASGRASADLSTMVAPKLELHDGVTSLIGLTDETLPCCDP
jgi:sulfite exporter TauE/SafE